MPRTNKVTAISSDSQDKYTAPQYLVYPISWGDVTLDNVRGDFITGTACIIDFGESFDVSDPPLDLGIPQIYCSPEYALDKNIGFGCDIWALGCRLFDIRKGRRLFDTFDDDLEEYLCAMAMVLAPSRSTTDWCS